MSPIYRDYGDYFLNLETGDVMIDGEILWDMDLTQLVGSSPYTVDGTTVFLPHPWPWSSIQSDGNTPTETAEVSVDPSVTRNSRSAASAKIVLQPHAQRCSLSARDALPPLQGHVRPTADGNDNDLWYGYSQYWGSDWGSLATLEAEMSGTMWSSLMSFRSNPTEGEVNGSMNVSGDDTDSDGVGGTINSTPRTMYLRRNTVLHNSGFYTDGLGLDKLSMGQAVIEQWMDFVVHVKWSTTTTNALREIWRDGVYMGSKISANAVDTASHAWRLGLYQTTDIDHARTMWIDNARIGTSYSAVNPASEV